MENFDQPMDMGMAAGKDDGLQITPELRQYWKEISNWALFFAILLFIVFGLVAIMGLMMAVAGLGGFISGLFVIAIYAAIVFFPGYFYYKFSTQMKQALHADSTELLDLAFVDLKRFYRYVGIMVIVFVSLAVLFMLIFGSMVANSGFPD